VLAELAIANAAFKIIKTTLSNGRELLDAGDAVGNYFKAEKDIAKAAASGKGDVLAAFQAKETLARQEEELKYMLNKQRLQGYADFIKFKAQYTRDLREAELAARKKKAAQQKALEDNITLAIKVMGILLVIVAALFGVALYLRN
tara:strand:- start:903 stop:1337 length:435 start_codon:yes stop_codon:yes gene_type:complete